MLIFVFISLLYSRSIRCNTIFSSSSLAFGCSFFLVRLAKSSICPTLRNDGATRVVIATSSLIILSGSLEYEPFENQGRLTFSVLEVYKLKDLDVGILSECICSCAKNSLILERKTALPSAPLQYGVFPPPFSCISQRFSFITASNTEIALPSPYPFPVPNGHC